MEVENHHALSCLVLKTEGKELVVEREGREGRLVASLFWDLATEREAVSWVGGGGGRGEGLAYWGAVSMWGAGCVMWGAGWARGR